MKKKFLFNFFLKKFFIFNFQKLFQKFKDAVRQIRSSKVLQTQSFEKLSRITPALTVSNLYKNVKKILKTFWAFLDFLFLLLLAILSNKLVYFWWKFTFRKCLRQNLVWKSTLIHSNSLWQQVFSILKNWKKKFY